MRIYERFDKTSENREPQRAYYIPYDTLEKAIDGNKECSAYYKLLNGNWCFRYFERDIDVPDKIDTWDEIKVPSCWQTLRWMKALRFRLARLSRWIWPARSLPARTMQPAASL